MTKKKLVELQSVSAGYNSAPVIKDINLTVYKGDFLGLIGPNGCGKTTLLKVILGLIKPAGGNLRYHFDRIDSRRTQIGYLPQLTMFDKRFPITVEEVVLSGLMAMKIVGRSFRSAEIKKADSLFQILGIQEIRGQSVGELSGGQLQRTFLARALVSSPSLLLLDEPNTFVDKKIERGMFEILKDLNREMAIILVSHDLGMISSYVKSIACLSDGLHIHDSNEITQELLDKYHCPIDLITHGDVPHRVLKSHSGNPDV